ncbi:hypothetical protein SS1G_07754 [Sclerotinia sclerotiorum 1980 UF-70]|uniref:Uncharacterized protein n=1 Tax=Sclerotinia sclerotiorum (strain ATCC 18683 / 1980 / Ss-1) TaxID=665079 RepID=A7ER01_SCLS1|nr:hypothetical protein SS1G_07754 [Sclerotinia sclerotiorum 1980 UF-70]EDN91893.1 hypothetical protein SS1G_07754 [Sclerotinia sclerotiorum 1980 UF-70]
MSTSVTTSKVEQLLAPLLASLPAASVSPQPPTALLPLLSPILRQRVQILSSTSDEPWLPLLCYDASNISKLEQAIRNDRLEAHPVSGEVEIDWEMCGLYGASVMSLVVVMVGGSEKWEHMIGENQEGWGKKSIASAETAFLSGTPQVSTRAGGTLSNVSNGSKYLEVEDDDDDDDYWAQYDNTPSRTPAPKHSPAPQSMQSGSKSADDEDSYYAQYADVQPAMDSHDPDEAAQNGTVETSLGQDDQITSTLKQNLQNHMPSHEVKPWDSESSSAIMNGGEYVEVVQPRPGSRTSSSGSETVAKLEKRAEAREQNEVGIKQHISTSVKSLYRLAKVAGIERAEFDRLIRTELDCLSLMDEDDE